MVPNASDFNYKVTDRDNKLHKIAPSLAVSSNIKNQKSDGKMAAMQYSEGCFIIRPYHHLGSWKRG